jgi:hypothetical protein
MRDIKEFEGEANEYDALAIMCPPLADFKEQPKDQSHCDLVNCPVCGEKMWLSDEKKKAIFICLIKNKRLICGCYRCIEKMTQKEFMEFDHIELINIRHKGK